MHVTGSPTLWGSFAFLATVRLPFLFGHVYVLIHVLRTAVVGQRLVLAGRGRDGMRVKPSRQTGINQPGSLVSHPAKGGVSRRAGTLSCWTSTDGLFIPLL